MYESLMLLLWFNQSLLSFLYSKMLFMSLLSRFCRFWITCFHCEFELDRFTALIHTRSHKVFQVFWIRQDVTRSHKRKIYVSHLNAWNRMFLSLYSFPICLSFKAVVPVVSLCIVFIVFVSIRSFRCSRASTRHSNGMKQSRD